MFKIGSSIIMQSFIKITAHSEDIKVWLNPPPWGFEAQENLGFIGLIISKYFNCCL